MWVFHRKKTTVLLQIPFKIFTMTMCFGRKNAAISHVVMTHVLYKRGKGRMAILNSTINYVKNKNARYTDQQCMRHLLEPIP
jgi:hypothetical protein